MKISIPLTLLVVFLALPSSEAALMDTLMKPITWIMQGPSTTLSWFRSNRTRSNETQGNPVREVLSTHLPLTVPESLVVGNETDEIAPPVEVADTLSNVTDTSEVLYTPQNATEPKIIEDEITSFRNESETVTVLPSPTFLSNVTDIIEPTDTDNVIRPKPSSVNASESKVIEDDIATFKNETSTETVTVLPLPTTLRTLQLITESPQSTPNPGNESIYSTMNTTQAPAIEVVEIVTATTAPETSSIKPVETTSYVNPIIETNVRQPRKQRLFDDKTEGHNSTKSFKPSKESAQVSDSKIQNPARKLISMLDNPPAALLELISNLTASHIDFKKARKDYEDQPQPVYIHETHSVYNNKEVVEPHFEFHSELAKALGVHHNEKKRSPNRI